MVMGVVLGLELSLKVGEFLKEGIGTDRKAKPSRWAPLDDASQDKIKKSLETTRNINSIIVKEKGIKKKQKTSRKTKRLKDSLDPSVAHAGEGRLEIPKG